ncbi:MAG: hypothetical protein K2M42_05855 [Oscillospiraceae bacterium]|nr:hypothetical protein [Oscillospiraceae bacterium]
MGPREVIANLNKVVHLPDGYKGRFTGATIRRRDSGEVFYQAELQDLTAEHSIRICKLEDVEVIECST